MLLLLNEQGDPSFLFQNLSSYNINNQVQVLHVFQWNDYKATFVNIVTRFWRLKFRIRNSYLMDWM